MKITRSSLFVCINIFFVIFVMPSVLMFVFSAYSGVNQQKFNFELFCSALLCSALLCSALLVSLRVPPKIIWPAFILYFAALMIQAFQFLEYIYGLNLRDAPVHILAISSWPITAYIASISFLTGRIQK